MARLEPLVLTHLEAAVLGSMAGGGGPLADRLDLPDVDATESDLGAHGFSSLVARGLVRLDGESRRLDGRAAAFGAALVSSRTSIGVGVEGEPSSVVRIIEADGARLMLTPGAARTLEVGLLDPDVPLGELLSSCVLSALPAGGAAALLVELVRGEIDGRAAVISRDGGRLSVRSAIGSSSVGPEALAQTIQEFIESA